MPYIQEAFRQLNTILNVDRIRIASILKTSVKLARTEIKINFLTACRRASVYPKFIDAATRGLNKLDSVQCHRVRSKVDDLKLSILNEEIKNGFRTKAFLERETIRAQQYIDSLDITTRLWILSRSARCFLEEQHEGSMRLTKKLKGLTALAHAPDRSRSPPDGPGSVPPAATPASVVPAPASVMAATAASPASVVPAPASVVAAAAATPASVVPVASAVAPAETGGRQPSATVRGDISAEIALPREEPRENTVRAQTETTHPTPHPARTAKFQNLSGQEIEENLVELLEKGPKFTLTQSIQSRTFTEVETGMERGAFALRWKIEFQKRAAQGYRGLTQGSLKPRFPDGNASLPPAALGDIERSISTLKKKLMAIYRNHRSSGKNYTVSQRRAITQFKQDAELILKPSDKCKGFVLMTREDYISKVSVHISEYEPVPRNPTPKLEAKTKRLIKDTMDGKVDKNIVQAILPQCSRTAEFYGLPKNHKPTVPLRPIVSACGDPVDKLTWLLERVINQLLPFVPAHLTSTDDYIKRLSQKFPEKLPDGAILFSVDVTNIYGNIPVDEAIEATVTLLDMHKDSICMFDLTLADIRALLTHCLNNNFLKFGDYRRYYRQTKGIAMGSRVAPPLASSGSVHWERWKI